MLAPFQGVTPPSSPADPSDDFVEIGLLLPRSRASDLLRLARERQETVGQILRKLVDRALMAEERP